MSIPAVSGEPALSPSEPVPLSGARLPVLFALVLFLGAGLLFLVQPMVGKMILPTFGGAPAVWNTCMLFFQAALLAGYAYAHAAPAWLGLRRHAALHFGLLVLGLPALLLLRLPLTEPGRWAPPGGANPIPWLLLLLAVSVGYPFFVLAATAPLVQRWFTATGHRSGRDPYFLYAASNAGSLLALLAYPFLLEPRLTLTSQDWLWAGGYVGFVLLMAACAVVTARQPSPSVAATTVETPLSVEDSALSWVRRLRWVGLAFVPSSLMIGVTSYLSTNITPIPLLWVVPLALYLLSFIVVFTNPPLVSRRGAALALLTALGLQIFLLVFPLNETEEPVTFISLHLAAFLAAALYCHRELATDRPSPRRLTEFYLWLSVGGVLGGIFNALVAPAVFPYVVEYPAVIVLIGLLDAPLPGRRRCWWLDLLLPAGLGLAAAWGFEWTFKHGLISGRTVAALALGLALAAAYLLARLASARPLRLGLGVGVILVWLTFRDASSWPGATVIHVDRNFFGVHRVAITDNGHSLSLAHGSITHGKQLLDVDGRPRYHAMASTYYHPTGPGGQLFLDFCSAHAQSSIAIVGLGAGSLAYYGEPGQRFTFYDIDPAVIRLARNPDYFTYLADCKADACDVILGDARLRLAEARSHGYDLIVLDAFSGDAIPVHLLTRQALRLYLDKLAPHGVVAFHTSNLYLDLEPALEALARDAGLMGLAWDDQEKDFPREQRAEGKDPSSWVILARRRSDLGRLGTDARWQPLRRWPGVAVWTDDFSNLLSVFRRE